VEALALLLPLVPEAMEVIALGLVKLRLAAVEVAGPLVELAAQAVVEEVPVAALVQQISLQVQMVVTGLPVLILVVTAAVAGVVLTLHPHPMPGVAIMAEEVVVDWLTPLNLDQLAALADHLAAVAAADQIILLEALAVEVVLGAAVIMTKTVVPLLHSQEVVAEAGIRVLTVVVVVLE
jgi:hypothetical protein